MPIILTATSIGLFLETIWSASLGQTAVASVFGIFAGFWLSYAVLVIGLTHNWFGVAPASVQAAQELLLVFLGVNQTSTGLLKAGGYVILVFAAIGVYLYVNTTSLATGGRPLSLGKPVLHG